MTDCSFPPSDTPEFMELVSRNVSVGRPSAHGLDSTTYVMRCRDIWNAIEVDSLYRHRFIDDETRRDGSAEIYGVAVADVSVTTDESGTQWIPSDDYAALRKPLGAQRRELIFVYPPGHQREEPLEPQKEHLIVALFDVLGFSARLAALGLDEMHRRYQELISRALIPSAAEGKLSLAAGMLCGELRQGYLKLPMRFAYFSDTIVFWAPVHAAFTGAFLDRCASLVCNALTFGFVLRGAVSVGDAFFHRKSNTFLGPPLVEAARLESAQVAAGVALAVSARSIGLPPNRIIAYTPPVKPGSEQLLSGMVLDWPRHWREFHNGSLSDTLRGLRSEPFEKYDGALAFVAYSEAHHDWFMAELKERLGAVAPIEVRDRHGT